jgi:Phosphodiester glycosidase
MDVPLRSARARRLRRFIAAGHVSLILSVVCATNTTSVHAEPPRFRTVAPGIEHATFEVRSPSADPFSGHAFRINLDLAALRLVPAGGRAARQTVDRIAAAYPAVVAANASFFDREGRTMGLAVDQSQVMATGRLQNWGALVVDTTTSRIVLGSEIQDPSAHRLIVQGIPRLLVGGVVPRLKPQVAERTAVCAGGSVVVLVVTTRVEATEFARFLGNPLESGGLGCSSALNLDGGPSTQLAVTLPSLSLSVPGGWGVPNALVVIPGKP